jgi:hypothetical protein
LRTTKALPENPAVEDLTHAFRAAATPICPDCGADLNTSTGATLLEIVRAHQRIWHGTAGR